MAFLESPILTRIAICFSQKEGAFSSALAGIHLRQTQTWERAATAERRYTVTMEKY